MKTLCLDPRARLSSVRRGFTLVELLVVIAIIGTLVGLLLPAVQSARAASRNMACVSNMKQLAMGLLSHESAMRGFPPLAVATDDMNGNATRIPYGTEIVWSGFYGWGSFVLPFIEESSMYNALNPTKGQPGPATSAQKYALAQTKLSAFRCPEDDGPDLMEYEAGKTYLFTNMYASGAAVGTPGAALSNYVAANRAVGAVPLGFSPAGSPSSACTTKADPKRGGFIFATMTSFKDLTDGSSSTIALGERGYIRTPKAGGTMVPSQSSLAGTWVGGGQPVTSAVPADGQMCQSVGLAPTRTINSISRTYRTLSSLHPAGGVNTIAFDGSYHFVSQNIEHIITITTKNLEYTDPVDSVFERLIAVGDGGVASFE